MQRKKCAFELRVHLIDMHYAQHTSHVNQFSLVARTRLSCRVYRLLTSPIGRAHPSRGRPWLGPINFLCVASACSRHISGYNGGSWHRECPQLIAHKRTEKIEDPDTDEKWSKEPSLFFVCFWKMDSVQRTAIREQTTGRIDLRRKKKSQMTRKFRSSHTKWVCVCATRNRFSFVLEMHRAFITPLG